MMLQPETTFRPMVVEVIALDVATPVAIPISISMTA